MQLYSFDRQFPITSSLIPNRIRLANGMTRTDKSTFTDEELVSARYIAVDAPPIPGANEEVIWNGESWELHQLTDEQIAEKVQREWDNIRTTRSKLLKEVDWRVLRYQSEVRLGVPTTDDIEQLDVYANALRDITKQSDPYNVEWPEPPFQL